jgi:hypothetical protein
MIRSKLVVLIEIILLSVALNSCCNKHDENSGVILADFEIENYPDWRIKNCYNLPNTYCIVDDSTYKKIFSRGVHTSECPILKLPALDFSKVSLLIFKKDMPTPTNFNRNVEIDTIQKIISYSIKVKRYFCPDASGSLSYNMVIVPKIGNDYRIEYK